MKCSPDAIKLLEECSKQLNWTEETAKLFRLRAEELAKLDGSTIVEGRHMLQSLGER